LALKVGENVTANATAQSGTRARDRKKEGIGGKMFKANQKIRGQIQNE
jgi:hypothetical protein